MENTTTYFTLKQVGLNVWAAISPGGQANAGIVIGDDGVVVIDTMITADMSGNVSDAAAQQLVAEIRKLTSLPIKFAINTHYHLDHTGGNAVLRDAGALLLAHRNVRTWMHPESLRLFGDQPKPEHKQFVEAQPLPNVVYDDGIDLHLGARNVEVRAFPGHTGGDSVVLIHDAKVVFAGDLFWNRILPNLMDSSTALWIDSLKSLTGKFADYTFVPGHGDVGASEDAQAFMQYLMTLRTLVTSSRSHHKSGESLVEDVMPTLSEKYGQWDFFQYFGKPNVVDVEAELNGNKRLPPSH